MHCKPPMELVTARPAAQTSSRSPTRWARSPTTLTSAPPPPTPPAPTACGSSRSQSLPHLATPCPPCSDVPFLILRMALDCVENPRCVCGKTKLEESHDVKAQRQTEPQPHFCSKGQAQVADQADQEAQSASNRPG